MLHAVVIGVDSPRDPRIRPLEFAVADAEAVAAVLADSTGMARQITLLTAGRATKASVAKTITDELPRRVGSEDAVLIYFAGYGCPELDGSGASPSIHLVLDDTEHARLHTTSINLVSELSAWSRRLPANVVATVLDASFNGLPGGRTFEGPGLWSGPRMRTLDRMSPSRAAVGGRFALLTACNENQVAREEPAYGHGVFTYHLVAALRAALCSPDIQGRSVVSVAALHRAVCGAVEESTHGAQRPAVHGGGAGVPLFRSDTMVTSALAYS